MKKYLKLTALALTALLAGTVIFGCAPAENSGGDKTDPGISDEENGNPPNTNDGNIDGNVGDEWETGTEPPAATGEALGLSRESGAYAKNFILNVSKSDVSHTIYYTLNGSAPTTASSRLGEEGIAITSDMVGGFSLTDAVVWTPSSHGNYTFGKNNACTVVRLLETDAEGKTVAEKTATYFIKTGGEQFYSLPVISISMPGEQAISFYNDIENESKERANLEYFDFASGERFAINTQIKVGGNWTKGYPYRTMNVNFNKNENGKKNTPVTVDLFRGRSARDGSELTDFTRFRLHSGGNAQTLNWFADAFAQTVVANIPSSAGYLNVSTTGYRPCEVYLNGEYWGLYAIREHYSDVYFQQNYGVDKDDVIMLDRAPNFVEGDPAYADASVFNTTYKFEVGEDTEEETGMELATELFDFLMSADLSDPAEYACFENMVDVDSLIDMVLVHFYAGNWDFLYNNIKMWRTGSVDESNPYADGKWRFCLHDLDFSFEFQWGDNGLSGANGYTLGPNYLDFYLGNAYLEYNGTGYLPEEVTCILSAPMRNADFRARFIERAQAVKEIFGDARTYRILDEMKAEIAVPMQRHLARWNRAGYNYGSWEFFVERTRNVLQWRTYLQDEYRVMGGGAVYPSGDYFDRQIEAALMRFLNN